jgi:hypothetical protein
MTSITNNKGTCVKKLGDRKQNHPSQSHKYNPQSLYRFVQKKMKQETLSPCFGHYKQSEDFSYLAKIVYSGKKSRAALLGW